jgi:pimeloyl-ACP methyl ester carboxylesterase
MRGRRWARSNVRRWYPPALAQEIAAGVAGSRLVVIADCGHLTTMERPDAVNRALVEWLMG